MSEPNESCGNVRRCSRDGVRRPSDRGTAETRYGENYGVCRRFGFRQTLLGGFGEKPQHARWRDRLCSSVRLGQSTETRGYNPAMVPSRALLLFACIGLLAAVASTSALGRVTPASETRAANAPSACAPSPLRFRGVEYHARSLTPQVKRGRRLGGGLSIDRACVDTVVCVAGQPCTPPPPPPAEFRPINVFRLVGVDPRVAVTREDAVRGWVWVASDRCRASDSAVSLRRCLRRS